MKKIQKFAVCMSVITLFGVEVSGATVAGFCKPAYLQTVLNAADRGRGVKLIITDSASYHTSYSVQYEIRTI